MRIYDWFSAVWYNFPRGVSTFSQCPCGRKSRRGGGECVLCLVDLLVATGKVTKKEVEAFIVRVNDLVKEEARLVEKVGEDTRI
jgi:hypothetical protein